MRKDGTVDALCVGEAMVALRCAGRLSLGDQLTPAVAGAESNVAIGLARLGHLSAWCGVIGSDQAGALVERTLKAESVDTTAIRRDPVNFTGLMVREDRLASIAQVDYHRRGSAGSRLTVEDVRVAIDMLHPRLVHLSGVTVALSPHARQAATWLTGEAQARGICVSLDLNHRRRLWSDSDAAAALTELLPYVDILIGSEDELPLLAEGEPRGFDRQVEDLLAQGPSEVVVKRGALGASAYAVDAVVHAPARVVTAVDTVGAGDAFCAGYLSGWLDGLGLAGKLDRGVVLGAFAVASPGDWAGLPTRQELELVNLPSGEVLR